MNTKERLLTFIAHQGMNISQFEKECGFPNSYVSNIRQTIMPDRLNALLAHFPRLNVDWLMTGRGVMEFDEVPPIDPCDPVMLYDEYARMLELSLYLDSSPREEIMNLQLNIAKAMELLSKRGESSGQLTLLYRRVIRLQQWLELKQK